jgi:LEA14-like dessication related protein
MTRTILISHLLLGILLSSACGFRRPQVALANVVVDRVRIDGVSLDILLDILNPNRWHVDLQRLTYNVTVAETPLGRGATETRITIGPGECATIRIPMDVEWMGAGRLGREIFTGLVEYRIAGELTVGTPLGTFTRNYSHTDEFSPLDPLAGAGGARGRLCAEGRPSE